MLRLRRLRMPPGLEASLMLLASAVSMERRAGEAKTTCRCPPSPNTGSTATSRPPDRTLSPNPV